MDKQAANIVLLDIREVCSFADYFVICNGEAERQIEAIKEAVAVAMKEGGLPLHHSEGTPDSGWILLDFGDIVIHIFAPMEREYYQLDSLWSKARLLVRVQ